MSDHAYIHFVGIGGIGMSALAQLFHTRGIAVTGSDREESPTTVLLGQKGIVVSIGHEATAVPFETDWLIYSDAIPADNPERVQARERQVRESSYFEALGEVSRSVRTIAVTGTHGKTTTTAMLAKILHTADKEPTTIVGSIVRDFSPAGGSNFLAGRDDLFVVEACEYRDHVLKLSPEILVITNIELDHTDYFPTLSALQETFRKAIAKVPAHGYIITDPHDRNVAPLLSAASATIVDYTHEVTPALNLLGEFNMMNARAAAAAARAAFPDIPQGTIDRALLDFHGSWRRFEYKGETPKGALVYDDYAHHPTAIEKTLRAVREKFHDKRIVVAFHPHLHSRTESFLQEFAGALDLADRAIVAPIYEARTETDHHISNHSVAEASRARGGHVEAMDSFDEIRTALLLEPAGTIIITMGAGDIYKVAEEIIEE